MSTTPKTPPPDSEPGYAKFAHYVHTNSFDEETSVWLSPKLVTDMLGGMTLRQYCILFDLCCHRIEAEPAGVCTRFNELTGETFQALRPAKLMYSFFPNHKTLLTSDGL